MTYLIAALVAVGLVGAALLGWFIWVLYDGFDRHG